MTQACSHGKEMLLLLGPLLFLLYINDLPNSSSKLSFYWFADYKNIYYEANNVDVLQRVVNKELKKVKAWFDVNLLSLNIEKTNFIVFKSPRISTQSVNIKVGKQPVRQATYVKFLGKLLDEHLN